MPTKDTSWMDSASCLGVDFERFFPGKGQRTDVVQKYCSQCPVSSECLSYALSNESGGGYHHYGIYGGLGPADRKRLTASRNRT